MKKTSGFTLIELMIVVAIIAIIAAIAIPNLLRSRIQSNETSAIGALRAIAGAQTGYSATNGNYATSIANLQIGTGADASTAYLVGNWPNKSGYRFTSTGTLVSGVVACYDSNANPTSYKRTGIRYFYSDCSGVIYQNTVQAAQSSDTPIDSLGTGT